MVVAGVALRTGGRRLSGREVSVRVKAASAAEPSKRHVLVGTAHASILADPSENGRRDKGTCGAAPVSGRPRDHFRCVLPSSRNGPDRLPHQVPRPRELGVVKTPKRHETPRTGLICV